LYYVLFQLIYSNLRTFPTESYYWQKYLITFYDNYTLYTWILALITKNKALNAIHYFLAFIEIQYHAVVQQWMLDGSSKYKLVAFDKILKNREIKILQSILYMPQQNGHSEQLIQTLSDKAESMYFNACLSKS